MIGNALQFIHRLIVQYCESPVFISDNMVFGDYLDNKINTCSVQNESKNR